MKLENYLILNKYFLDLFGFSKPGDLFEGLKKAPPGFPGGGKSRFVETILSWDNLKISPEDLLRYDGAIKEYSDRLSQNRREAINLKYFQYLAILFAEIFFDSYFHRQPAFLGELNSFVRGLNEGLAGQKDKFSYFGEGDLEKLAYWMATGSGKTLIMHINYWQFLRYKKGKLDNIILVTSNEGMSQQHYEEMQRSGVPCVLYSPGMSNLNAFKDEVLVIDIHKLTREKKGAGVTVEVDYFEGRNLVLIDEGHKGQATEEKTWKKLREQLGKGGFILEYSATFGQVIGAEEKDLLEEYSKAIIFDYSYKYFYNDGYGKDFYIYNLAKGGFQDKFKELILTGNLLSFYEQLLLYRLHNQEIREYKIEKPLWAFVGSKVSGGGIDADVFQVVRFLDRVIQNRALLEENTEKVLKGNPGIPDPQGNDIFKSRFGYLRQSNLKIDDLYEKTFNSRTGALSFYEIKSAEGEIGLKVGDGDYFGVINIGDPASFKKLLAGSGYEVKADSITSSLFQKVKDPGSNINIIIGAKKFIEGWDTWRVCSMGLINMGKGEGPQIVQLFGRGVRLKGRDFSLKRSEEKKFYLKALETLNIFGLNADYINTFLEAIRKEEVEYEEIAVPLRWADEKKWNKLYYLQLPLNFQFSNQLIELEVDEDLLHRVKIDIRPRIRFAHGLDVLEAEAPDEPVTLEPEILDLLNWDEIYLEMLRYKVSHDKFNLGIKKDMLSAIIRSGPYQIYAFPEQVRVENFEDLGKIKEIALMVLESYVDRFYNFRLRQEESRELKPVFLAEEKANLNYGSYTVRVPKDKQEDIKKINALLKEAEKLYRDDLTGLPRLHFDRHLYTPLIIYRKEKDHITSDPAPLNEGEARFIQYLRDYLKAHEDEFKGKDIFLLRNLSQRGVRFFQTSGFYPDFIMWRKQKGKQTVAFIDPKGIRNVEEEKIQLHATIKELEKTINKKDLRLESFVLSVSKWEDIKKLYGYGKKNKADLEKEHVIFMKDKGKNPIEKLFQMLA